jgi:hypothetical protein
MEREHTLRHKRLQLLLADRKSSHRVKLYKEWLTALDTLHSIGLLNGSQHKRIEAKINSTYNEAVSLISGEDGDRPAAV